ncbi:MAG: hypothetical protein U9N02_02105 [Campylobacterota bacterium]|nr:hypothetical protein [Campylobacterota bacterium]
MNKYYLADSGQEKRYSKAIALGEVDVTEAIDIAKKHIFLKKQKHKEYAKYEMLRDKILRDTNNKIEKAIVFDSNGSIIFEKSGVKDKIEFTDSEVKKMNGNYLIHKHSSGKSLSYQDIVLTIKTGLKEIVATAGYKNFYRLIIKKDMDIDDVMLKYKIQDS